MEAKVGKRRARGPRQAALHPSATREMKPKPTTAVVAASAAVYSEAWTYKCEMGNWWA